MKKKPAAKKKKATAKKTTAHQARRIADAAAADATIDAKIRRDKATSARIRRTRAKRAPVADAPFEAHTNQRLRLQAARTFENMAALIRTGKIKTLSAKWPSNTGTVRCEIRATNDLRESLSAPLGAPTRVGITITQNRITYEVFDKNGKRLTAYAERRVAQPKPTTPIENIAQLAGLNAVVGRTWDHDVAGPDGKLLSMEEVFKLDAGAFDPEEDGDIGELLQNIAMNLDGDPIDLYGVAGELEVDPLDPKPYVRVEPPPEPVERPVLVGEAIPMTAAEHDLAEDAAASRVSTSPR